MSNKMTHHTSSWAKGITDTADVTEQADKTLQASKKTRKYQDRKTMRGDRQDKLNVTTMLSSRYLDGDSHSDRAGKSADRDRQKKSKTKPKSDMSKK